MNLEGDYIGTTKAPEGIKTIILHINRLYQSMRCHKAQYEIMIGRYVMIYDKIRLV